MIGGTVRVVVAIIVTAAVLVAVAMALGADLFAAETRPALPRMRFTRKRSAIRSLMEAST